MTPPEPLPHPTPASSADPAPHRKAAVPAWVWPVFVLGVVAAAAIVIGITLWQRLDNIQQQLALQSADTRGQAVQASTQARQADDAVRDTAARMALLEARVSEVALQRGQLDALMQSLARDRDGNLIDDLDAAIRFALQQSSLSGSSAPLVSSLKTAQQRVAAAAQPSLAPLERAIARDLDHIAASKTLDTAGLLARIDELLHVVDELPLQNDVIPARVSAPHPQALPAGSASAGPSWWQSAVSRLWQATAGEMRSLVRVRRIDHPEAALLAPGEAFFLRENIKLRLLNARMGLLARQLPAAQGDLRAASDALRKYFDLQSRRAQNAAQQLQQLLLATQGITMPGASETLAALASAASLRP